jgi:hypothetical protein
MNTSPAERTWRRGCTREIIAASNRECFPLLPLVELQAMSLDIAKNGLIHPIVIFESKILEGRKQQREAHDIGIFNDNYETMHQQLGYDA